MIMCSYNQIFKFLATLGVFCDILKLFRIDNLWDGVIITSDLRKLIGFKIRRSCSSKKAASTGQSRNGSSSCADAIVNKGSFSKEVGGGKGEATTKGTLDWVNEWVSSLRNHHGESCKAELFLESGHIEDLIVDWTRVWRSTTMFCAHNCQTNGPGHPSCTVSRHA